MQKGRPLAGRTHSGMPAKKHASDIAAIRCHVQANKLLMLAALWERPCRFGLARTEQAPPRTMSHGLFIVDSKRFCQQTESQKMGMTSNRFIGLVVEAMPMFWLSVCWPNTPWPRAPTRRCSWAGRVGACGQWGGFPFGGVCLVGLF